MAGRIWGAVALTLVLWGCGVVGTPLGDQIIAVSQVDQSNTDLEIGIAIQVPTTSVSVQGGDKTTLAWSDIAKEAGTTVRLQAQRVASIGSTVSGYGFTGPVLNLIGDGTPGSGRDAVADGQNDSFSWDTTGVRIGSYLITATIESPTGMSQTAVSADSSRNTAGLIVITTALPAPTLTFTKPGNTDATATAPTVFAITWTDNGTANPDAGIVLELDPDSDHNNGNEIVIGRDVLSNDGNSGEFDFNYVDERGNAVPTGTYSVVARLDDNVHDIVTVTATGKLNVVE
jgi:hypothetical protein